MKTPRLISATLIYFLASNIHAAIIDNGYYTTDTETGLDWLDLTETARQSFNTVEDRMKPGGDLASWTRATGAQFETLITHMGGTPMTNPPCYNYYDDIPYTYCGESAANNGIVELAISYLGSNSGPLLVEGILADTSDTGRQIVAILNDDPLLNPNIETTDFIWTWGSEVYAPDDAIFTSGGSFLVRQSEVPVPAAAWLFGSALIGLVGLRRK